MAPLLASDEAESRVLSRRAARLGRFVRRPFRYAKRATFRAARKWSKRLGRKFESQRWLHEHPEVTPSGEVVAWRSSKRSSKKQTPRRSEAPLQWCQQSPLSLSSPSPGVKSPYFSFPRLETFTNELSINNHQLVPPCDFPVASPVSPALSSPFSPALTSVRGPLLTSLVRSEMALKNSAPPASGFPPRMSSRQQVDDMTFEAGVRSFSDLVTRHPEVDGTVIQTNIVRAAPPRAERVVGGLRNAFTFGRSSSRPRESFEIQNPGTESLRAKKPVSKLPWKSASTTALRSLAHPLATVASVEPTPTPSPAPADPLVPPTAQRGRPKNTAVQEAQRVIADLTRRHDQELSRQRRKAILEDIIKLQAQLSTYKSREERCAELESMVAMYRAETAMYRRGLLGHVDQVLMKYDDLNESEDPESGMMTGREF